MSRTRWRLGLSVTALLTASALLPSPAHAEAVADYTITVDPSGQGPTIDDTMYGVFYEDINRAADGGLYAELVQNRSFEYSTADHASYTPLTGWAADGTAEVVNDGLPQRAHPHLPLAGRRFHRHQRGLQHRHPGGEGCEVRLLGLGPAPSGPRWPPTRTRSTPRRTPR
ncbi:hypothetical protein STENM327S_04222 [Streptomyces tendae]